MARRSNIKRATCEALAAALAIAVPALSGRIHAIPEDWEAVADYPALAIEIPKAQFLPWQEGEVDDTVDGQLVTEVGNFEGMLKLSLIGSTPAEREDLEQALLDAFNGDGDAPGLLRATLQPVALSAGGVVTSTAYAPGVAFALDDEEWREEMVFTHKRESVLELSVQYPVLMLRKPVYSMNTLILQVTHDLDSSSPVIDEQVQIHDDGTTTNA